MACICPESLVADLVVSNVDVEKVVTLFKVAEQDLVVVACHGRSVFALTRLCILEPMSGSLMRLSKQFDS
jgi:hypothetical protein